MQFSKAASYLGGAALAAGLAAGQPAFAQDTGQPPVPRITVTGEGTVSAAPDMAILTLSVIHEAETARDAVTGNNAAMTEVVNAMKDAGIADNDLQTSGFSISPRYARPKADDPDGEPRIAGYRAQNSLSVRVRNIADTGIILDRAVSLGVNASSGLVFTNDDPSAFLTEARTKAVADAVARAKTLAEAAGVSVGRILDMSEQSYRPSPVPFAKAEMMVARGAADAVPLHGGENDYIITVNIVFVTEH